MGWNLTTESEEWPEKEANYDKHACMICKTTVGAKKKRIHNDSITKAKLWFQSLSLSWEAELFCSLCKNVHILDFGDIDNYHQL